MILNAKGRKEEMLIDPFITREVNGRAKPMPISKVVVSMGMDIFERGLCLPSDNKMTAEEQDQIIEIIKKCFEV